MALTCFCTHEVHPGEKCPSPGCMCEWSVPLCPECVHSSNSSSKGKCVRQITRPGNPRYGQPCGCEHEVHWKDQPA